MRWFKFGWTSYNWDYAYLIETLEFKLRLLEEGLRKDWDYVGREKHLKQIHTCALLCRRIAEDDYMFNWDRGYFANKKDYAKCFEYEKKMLEQDKELLFSIMKKHMEKWWV